MVSTYLLEKSRTTNAAGAAHVHTISDLDTLKRFLILGTVGGTYYVGEREFTLAAITRVKEILAGDAWRQAVNLIVEIGTSNRAPKHDPVLVAYALALSAPRIETRQYAEQFFPQVVRTGTHLFHLVAYLTKHRGWGRIARRAVARWYTNQREHALAYGTLKYQQRDGWSHRDVLRLAHPVPTSDEMGAVFAYITQGRVGADTPNIIKAYEHIKGAESKDAAIDAIETHNFSREMLPSQYLNDPEVWTALIRRIGPTALLRNLRNIERYGLLDDARIHPLIHSRLTKEALTKGRVHPLQVYQAYEAVSNARMTSFLEGLFIESFDLASTPVTGKHLHVSLDISGSMTWARHEVNGLTPWQWGTALVYVLAHTEPNASFSLFSSGLTQVDADLIRGMGLAEFRRWVQRHRMSATDASLPILDALANRRGVDSFIMITDNETGTRYGSEVPSVALQRYRRASRRHEAGMISIAMSATDYSVADPDDPYCHDIAGMDANVPSLLNEMIGGLS